MKLTRKMMMSVAGVAAAVLLMSSAAFACLTTKGNMKITGAGGTAGETVIGNNGSMTFCANPGTAASQAKGSNITVAVAQDTCDETTKLPQKDGSTSFPGYYEVRLNSTTGTNASWKYNTTTLKWVFQNGTGCWKTGVSYQSLTTTYAVNGSGTGSASLTVPSDANVSLTNEAAGVCVGDGTNGMFAPLKIT